MCPYYYNRQMGPPFTPPDFPSSQFGIPMDQFGFPTDQFGFPTNQLNPGAPFHPGESFGSDGQFGPSDQFSPGVQFGPGGFPPIGMPPSQPPMGGGQTAGAPTSPPPGFIPQKPFTQAQGPGVFAVDPGAIRPCLFRFVYIWLRNGQQFWAWLVFVGPRSVSGFRWNRFRWAYFGTDLRNIDSFVCY